MRDLFRFHRKLALQGPDSGVEWIVFLLLFPWALLYGTVGWLRSKCYASGLFVSYRAAVPVVSVGNLAAGGTGKTPVVDWLVKNFLQQGKKVAVVSRGYGGTFSGEVGVVSKGDGLLLDAGQAGDEPYLLARRNPTSYVFVARKRAAGVRAAVEKFSADIVVLDDGFQHQAVRRDLDLVLLDAKYPLANGWPLPAGLLREFPVALQRADLLLLTRSTSDTIFKSGATPVFASQHRLAEEAVSLDGNSISFAQLAQKKLFAFAGIADPSHFFSALTDAGLPIVSSLPLGDHCDYDSATLRDIKGASQGCEALITTEKDAVKLTNDCFDLPCYQVPMSVFLENEAAFKEALEPRLWSEK